MNTLKGVIAASTGKGVVIPDEADLYIVPWYFTLTSQLYHLDDTLNSSVTNTHVKESPSVHTNENSGASSVVILGGQSSGTWKQNPIDELNATGWVNEITMTRTTRYSSTDAGVDELSGTGWVTDINMIRTVGYVETVSEPQEINATGWVSGIIMTRTSG